MDIDSIRNFCLAFPQATENLQWGGDLCFKVQGKLFAIVGLDSVPPALCVKTSPQRFAELVEIEGIKPAPYVGRYKWVLLERLDALPDDDIRDCIQQSYEMISAKLPAKRPAKTKSSRAKPSRKKRKTQLRKQRTTRR